MPMLRRHHRDRYLEDLAAEPFFAGVPRHLIAVVGRSVDRFDLVADGDDGAADPAFSAGRFLTPARDDDEPHRGVVARRTEEPNGV